LEEKHAFLSDEWLLAAKQIRDAAPDMSDVLPTVKVNLVVTGVPFAEGAPLRGHVDTTGGTLVMDLAHLPDAPTTLTLDYETAKAILVDLDWQAGIAAFLAGRARAEGDIGQLMALSASPPDLPIADDVRSITA
jgi:hypothetical protein